MSKWEYKCLRFGHDDKAIEDELNILGKQRWELVGAVTMRTNFDASYVAVFTFKREIPETPDGASDDIFRTPGRDFPKPQPPATGPTIGKTIAEALFSAIEDGPPKVNP